jgi:hypothetical protein
MVTNRVVTPAVSGRPRTLDDREEVIPLATELATAYQTMVTFYREQLQLSDDDADARARGVDDSPQEAQADLDRIRGRPPDQVSWFDLNRVVERNPVAMAGLWADLKAAARDELASGHRTAQALTWDGRPWDRARFLAIRDSFRSDYQPASGVEAALVDLAAEAFADYLAWTTALHMQADTEAELERHDVRRHGRWKPQRLSSSEALIQSERIADRAYTRFLQTLATLDRRRVAPLHVGHLTIAPTQVIVAPLAEEDDAAGHRERM